MKKLLKLTLFIVLTFTFFFFLTIVGCKNADDSGITGPDTGTQQNSNDKISIVQLPQSTTPRPKHKIVHSIITPNSGGVILYSEIYQATTGQQVEIDLQLRFPPNAVSDTMDVSIDIKMDELSGDIGMNFGPSPTMFNKPAYLTFSVIGLNQSDLPSNPDKLKFMYDNNGTYIPMKAKNIFINESRGELTIQDGEVPHFSRYVWAT